VVSSFLFFRGVGLSFVVLMAMSGIGIMGLAIVDIRAWVINFGSVAPVAFDKGICEKAVFRIVVADLRTRNEGVLGLFFIGVKDLEEAVARPAVVSRAA